MYFNARLCLVIVTGLGLRQRVKDAASHCSGYMRSLTDRLSSLLVASRADSTTQKYYNAFRKWEDFIKLQDGSPLPAEPIQVALYLTYLVSSNSSFHAVSSAVYGIKWAHDLHAYNDPTKNSFVINTLEAAKRSLKKPVVKKDSVSVDMIIKLCDKYDTCTDLCTIRDLCLIVLCFSGFLRYSEVSSLKCRHIEFHPNYFTLFIERSKTDQYRSGNQVVISEGSTSACPYKMLKRYLLLADASTDNDFYLFRPINTSKGISKLIQQNRKLSYTRAREVVISRFKEVSGGFFINIGLHSLRSGGATAAANSSVNERCWKRHGRWKSESAKDGYVSDSLTKRLEVTTTLGL